jgi:hypothetical protein
MYPMEQIPDDDIINKLYSLQQLCTGNAHITNGHSFIDFYDKVKKQVEKYGTKEKSPYFTEKLAEFPLITSTEIDENINPNRKKFRGGMGISIPALIELLFKLTASLKQELENDQR